MLDDLHPDLRLRLERCHGAAARVVHVVPAEATVENAVEAIGSALGDGHHTRLGVCGMTAYQFAPQLYKNHGPKAAQIICEAAAEASIKGGWSHVLMGGSWGGPQRTFAEAFENTSSVVVHVLPNTGEAIVDLIYLLFDDAMEESTPRLTSSKFVFVGPSYRVRNCVLSTLCAQIFIIGGGPGTHLEVTAARASDVGLIPIVRTGGLAEGMDFGGRNLRGLSRVLADAPPTEIPPHLWKSLLGLASSSNDKTSAHNPNASSGCCGFCKKRRDHEEGVIPQRSSTLAANPSLEEYIESLRLGLGHLRPDPGKAPNRWPLSAQERAKWKEQNASLQKATAVDLYR